MRKKIIICSLLAVFFMLMLPTISAAETKVAQSNTTQQNLYRIEETYIDTIHDKYKNNPIPQCILLTLAILFLKLVRLGKRIITVGIILLIGGILLIIKILRNQNTTALIC
jgi:hypothetical protein